MIFSPLNTEKSMPEINALKSLILTDVFFFKSSKIPKKTIGKEDKKIINNKLSSSL